MNVPSRNALSMLACVCLGFGAAVMLGWGRPAPQFGGDQDKGQSIGLDAVPAAVKAAVEAHAPGTMLSHAWKQTENGATFYLVRGKAKDADKIEFRAVESGRLVEVMHDMPPGSLPADVVAQVQTIVPGGQIMVGERHMAIRWRLEVKDGARMREVVLRADGKHAVMDLPAKPGK